jgi:hypothetical protein
MRIQAEYILNTFCTAYIPPEKPERKLPEENFLLDSFGKENFLLNPVEPYRKFSVEPPTEDSRGFPYRKFSVPGF